MNGVEADRPEAPQENGTKVPRQGEAAVVRTVLAGGIWYSYGRCFGGSIRAEVMATEETKLSTLHWSGWLREIRRKRPLRNTYTETMANLPALDRVAVWITEHVGTMGFFLVIFVWTVIWLGWNFLAPERLRFDPPMGFVFWLFISNVIQILLMPLIMVGQNIQGRHAELRAEHDLEVNVKAEQEIEVILDHLERQNDLLIAMLEKQGLKLDEVLRMAEQRRAKSAGANVPAG
jgi:uncharacterized membrane protein